MLEKPQLTAALSMLWAESAHDAEMFADAMGAILGDEMGQLFAHRIYDKLGICPIALVCDEDVIAKLDDLGEEYTGDKATLYGAILNIGPLRDQIDRVRELEADSALAIIAELRELDAIRKVPTEKGV